MDEAKELLSEKLGGAKQKMQDCEEDLDFLREQITVRYMRSNMDCVILICYQTLEVATARVYNWDIGQRRKERIDNGDGNDDEDKSGAK